jgi:hypothetical protein
MMSSFLARRLTLRGSPSRLLSQWAQPRRELQPSQGARRGNVPNLLPFAIRQRARRLSSGPAVPETTEAPLVAADASSLPWWVEGLPYVAALAVGTVAYFSTEAELDADAESHARFTSQLALAAEQWPQWVADGKTDEFRDAVLQNFELQAKLADSVPSSSSSTPSSESHGDGGGGFKLGAFKWLPSVSHELTMGALAVAFLFVTPLPLIRALPRLPRELFYGLVRAAASLRGNTRHALHARDVLVREAVFCCGR